MLGEFLADIAGGYCNFNSEQRIGTVFPETSQDDGLGRLAVQAEPQAVFQTSQRRGFTDVHIEIFFVAGPAPARAGPLSCVPSMSDSLEVEVLYPA
jgi:hypothetical protein